MMLHRRPRHPLPHPRLAREPVMAAVRKVEAFGLPNCTTCQRVLKDLDGKGVKVTRFRDLKTEKLSADEVKELARKVGGPSVLFSRRALKYRALGLDKRELTDEEMLAWMTKEYTFVTRPVLVDGDRAVCGSGTARLRAFLDGQA